MSSFNLDTVRRIRAVDASVPVGLVTFERMSPDMLIDRAVAEHEQNTDTKESA